MGEVFIVEAVRTPIGKRNGALSGSHPVSLGARILRELVARAGVPPEAIEDVVMGCVTQTGLQGANIGRLATLHAGFPPEVPAVSINRMCGSSQQAIHFAAQSIAAGDADLAIAAGVESMSRVPMGSDFPSEWPTNFPYPLVTQGQSAEMVAAHWGLSRETLDDFSFRSHEQAAKATRERRFHREMLPWTPAAACDATALMVDEGVRLVPDRTRMAGLRPAFQADGVITAGNSSQMSDGAAAVLLASEAAVLRDGLRPRARVVARVVVGSDPVMMLTGPIGATARVLARAGLTIDDIDLYEVNEAFASVPLAWLHETGADPERLNVNGGAIALGHPLGASGARLMTTLLHELERRRARYGLQTMCIGHGMATATIIERLEGAAD